ncbi:MULTISPECIES: YbaB/EbfC family nucleoid-associated protein [unclassified Microbacterium]|uniref:YbaB/EbfC family nucleoid-associated protein n=1 Tax=unclassified Microbacterium TaxID=2609290 RepID=UPI00177BB9BD|nr:MULTISPECIES: YbaB/EbfC family nucleoid-associated protein [unclassified Microbacterium]MBD8207520.1 YbaB/EbfC family nucleoid-associated protein [Microbacterium sp. CFBP 8801]MBD8477061.1 YbaB/EbfC family nucleoid-associated protein [Microbacterium sp. CFBP 8794]MBD8509080.1 YbaB/EbfC family nucleoid-associated protein [Microbacterium sp. CFBP 8790]
MTESAEMHDALRKLDAQVAMSQHRAEQMQKLASDIEAIRVGQTSPGGELTVHVDANGRLVDITFTHRALVLDPRQVRSLLLDAVEDGYEEATRRSVALASETFGPDAPTVVGLRQNAERYRPHVNREDEG